MAGIQIFTYQHLLFCEMFKTGKQLRFFRGSQNRG